MTLYTIGNIKLNTVNLVAQAVLELAKKKVFTIEKVFIFNTVESSKDGNLSKQVDIYKKHFGEYIGIEEVFVDDNGLINPDLTANIFDNTDKKIIDITNGQKTTASLLYLVASLIDISNIFYVKLKVNPNLLPDLPLLNEHYEYVNLPIYKELPKLAKINQFDLIYYLNELASLFPDVKSKKLKELQKNLTDSIVLYFNKKFRASISEAVTCSEVIATDLFIYLENHKSVASFTKGDAYKVRGFYEKIPFLLDKISINGSDDKDLNSICNVGGLIFALRTYRNLVSHSGKNGFVFQNHHARAVINLTIEIYHTLKGSESFWKLLNTD